MGILNPIYLFRAISCAIYNMVFINFMSNIVPSLVYPAAMTQNVELSGGLIPSLVSSPYFTNPVFIISTWLFAFYCLGLLIVSSRRNKNFYFIVLFVFFMVSYLLVMSLGRLRTDEIYYVMAQPRYQLVPNFVVCLLAAMVLGPLYPAFTRIKKGAVLTVLALIIAMNSFFTYQSVAETTRQLAPLKRMLADIKVAIDTKKVNPDAKLVLPQDVTYNLPLLCWNRDLDRFIVRGSYEYLFRGRLDCFAFDGEGARYIMDQMDMKIKELD
jgi:hypothetical protein